MDNHSPRTIRLLSLIAVAGGLLLPGCTSDDSKEAASDSAAATSSTASTTTDRNGNVAAFCAAGETIDARTSTISSPEQARAVFTELDPTLDTMLATAPDDVTDAAATFVSIARAAVKNGDFTPFENGTVDSLVARLDTACRPGR